MAIKIAINILIIIAIITIILDATTTYIGIKKGKVVEANPLIKNPINKNPITIIPIAIITIILFLIGCYIILIPSNKIGYIIFFSCTIIGIIFRIIITINTIKLTYY